MKISSGAKPKLKPKSRNKAEKKPEKKKGSKKLANKSKDQKQVRFSNISGSSKAIENSEREAPESIVKETDVDFSNVDSLSSFEKKQLKLRQKLRDLEEQALEEKKWHLRGETQAKERPENSLVEAEDLTYDVKYISSPPPVVTNDLTLDFEELIKQRIADLDYDDVVRKLGKDDRIHNQAKNDIRELEETLGKKSSVGLGELYEQDYEQEVLGKKSKQEEAFLEKKFEIKNLFDNIMYKLNALSSFYYTPKPNKLLKEGVKVKKMKDNRESLGISAIEMEEKLPINVSESVAQTPEELYKLHKNAGLRKHDDDSKETGGTTSKTVVGVVKTDEEKTKEERRRQRQERKRAKRKRKAQKQASEKILAKLNPGLGNKYAKKKIKKRIELMGMDSASKRESDSYDDKIAKEAFSNSSQFFKMLKETVNDDNRRKNDSRNRRLDNEKSGSTKNNISTFRL